MRTAAERLVDALAANGVDRAWCVPGESYISVLDALHDHPTIDLVTCRHEAGAGFAAVADARLTGRPGVALVSRGPGACNASIAVHTAQQDAVPLLLIVGQVDSRDLRARSFQEIDYSRMFNGIAKFVGEATEPKQLPALFARAWSAMLSGVPGPAVLSLPEDILAQPCDAPDVPVVAAFDAAPSEAAIDRLSAMLGAAERPILLAGGDCERGDGRDLLLRVAEQWRVPVAVGFRRQDLFPNHHPLYAGDLGLSNPRAQRELFDSADLVIALGTRLGDITTQGYQWPLPTQALVHVCADPDWLGWRTSPALAIAARADAVLAGLAARDASWTAGRESWCAALHTLQAALSEAPLRADAPDGVVFANLVTALGKRLGDDAIVTLDAGTFGAPFYRRVAWRPPQRLLAPISGAMGYGMPAAVAAALRHPDRPTIAVVGDGGFLMTGNELAVAAARGLPLKVLISDNASYGSIRIHQERDYPGRVSGTNLANPDIGAIAAAFGFPVMRVTGEADVPGLLDALLAPGPLVAVVKTSLAAVLPR